LIATRKTITGALTAALLLGALPAATLAQDALDVTPEGVVWTLTSVGGTAVPAGVDATLYIEEGDANGNAGCNSYSGSYSLDGSSLSFDANMAVTQAFCEGPAQDVEDAFLPALSTVSSWSIEGIEMTLADESGATVLTFEEPAVTVTETDVIALDGELDRLNTRINNTRQDINSLDVDRLRQRVAGNEAILAEVSTRVQNQNVRALRDRVAANEAVLNEVTKRFINVRSRVRNLEQRVAALEKALAAQLPSN